MNLEEYNRCIHDHDYLIKKYSHNRTECMAFNASECKGDIIKAHTISKMDLKNLATNNHILIPKGSSHNQKNLYIFKEEGVNKATSFTGFCEKHDNQLFDSLEKNSFMGSYSQIYDCTFRALSRQFFDIKCVVKFIEKLKNGKLSSLAQKNYFQPKHSNMALSHKQKDVQCYRFLYDQYKKLKNNGLCYIVLKVSKLPIAASGVLFPLFDPAGNKIQKENERQHGFTYYVATAKNESYIVLATVKSLHSNIDKSFLRYFLKIDQKNLNFLLTSFFFNSDILLINPYWYNSLTQEFKDKLLILINANNHSLHGETNYATIIDFLPHLNIHFFELMTASFK